MIEGLCILENNNDIVIDFGCEKGSAVFFKGLPRQFESNPCEMDSVVGNVITLLTNLSHVKEDRLIVLLGDLVVENALEAYIAVLMPRYSSKLREKLILPKNWDFGFSLKIDVCRALGLLSPKVFTCADIVRAIRNAFVHNLEISSLDSTDKKIEGLRRELDEALYSIGYKDLAGMNTRRKYSDLVFTTTTELLMRSREQSLLNSFLRSDLFTETFNHYVETETGQKK
jgi:hypothetical protein